MPLDNNTTLDDLRRRITQLTLADEESCIRALTPLSRLSLHDERAVSAKAKTWLVELRDAAQKAEPIEKLIHRFRLTDKEGVALMGLAEALPRIPDDPTADALIADKLAQGNWRDYLEHYPDMISKMAWLGLSLGKDVSSSNPLSSWVNKISHHGLRQAVRIGMRKLGEHFVLGTTIEQALKNSDKSKHALQRYSFDMLGEAAHTSEDATRYFNAYKHALETLAGYNALHKTSGLHGPSISVKLSALHPRYEWAQHERVLTELTPRLLDLIEIAAHHNIGLTIDAEEVERLELSLAIIEQVFNSGLLKNYNGFGCAVQAYQKRAPAVLDWLYAHTQLHDIRITVRLVKGAYWDTEIKRAQERGLSNYPVYTRKEATDIAYLACAKKLLGWRDHIYPQFGTHNLRSVLSIRALAGDDKDYELQRLYNMGDDLHKKMLDEGVPSCVYAPVGEHKDLLGYLIRRLLENSANSSFINLLHHPEMDVHGLTADPLQIWEDEAVKPHSAIPLPLHIYGAERTNSTGVNLYDSTITAKITAQLKAAHHQSWQAFPIIDGRKIRDNTPRELTSPANAYHKIGECVDAIPSHIQQAMEQLDAAFPAWSEKSVQERCIPIERLGHKLEEVRDELIVLLCYEGGKTIADAIGEIRETVDYCRYYAARARELFAAPKALKGISGESNELQLHGRGVFVCIAPWNFPLAIFVGQIIGALLAGNTVAAKPAEQTPLIATKFIELMLECGVPGNVIALLPGYADVGVQLVNHPLVAGVAFTGSTTTARAINRALADKDAPIVPFIAETGGINALVVDSSALPEQVVDDVVLSAFRSAGQRCSAARLLVVQDSIADDVITMLKGALLEIRVDDPIHLYADVGPVIDQHAKEMLQAHERFLKGNATLIGTARHTEMMNMGHYVLPQAWEIPSIAALDKEVFGPILHVVRFKTGQLVETFQAINKLGYGLTGGIHSRIDSVIELAKKHMRVGNLYINRSIIGAVVGSQPFGGDALSGTGPKAGGPNYLLRFASERSITQNLTAAGGDVGLLRL
ncbi:MAG: bifunctional proline dehydrogenase/L-glutamate gamma-semialdehyde dehydrogenase PutA [Alphaproteobacteria bacterium]|nr:bifunctional proline dehydrogenase/L-glutamate gamma-semialdehyde dehydrogenase PutA [Alphaproteobacteria bacterium]